MSRTKDLAKYRPDKQGVVRAVLPESASDRVLALIEGPAAGAMLAEVAETMVLEAFHSGGGAVGC
jgi:hypothetical protein